MSNINQSNLRKDLALITEWIQPKTKVLDLGCGDGTLLTYLHEARKTTGYGVEKDDENWLAAMRNGVDVIQMNLEDGLSEFENSSFDTVVLSQTLQAMHNTEAILQEMLRVGNEAVVTFPNFGYWRNRMQLVVGRMPVSKSLPHEWHNTPNVHLCTIHDFDALCEKLNITVIERKVVTGSSDVNLLPNWLGDLAMYRLRK